MWWLFSLLNFSVPMLGLYDKFSYYSFEKEIIGLFILGVVPGTSIQLNYYQLYIFMLFILGLLVSYEIMKFTKKQLLASYKKKISEQLKLISI